MELNADVCYQAILSRDARFDGRFFVGVASTGIYCRPVCRVRTPQRKNCSFFQSAAAAEQLGFRPCLKCRPELAPDRALLTTSGRLAQSAARMIEAGIAEDIPLPVLARRVGVTDRHLRRIFQAEFGVAPIAWAQTQRLLLAKQLLTDTAMPVTDVAHAAGFKSVRRFNALIKSRYRLAPTGFRRVAAAAPQSTLSFRLAVRPPYAWDELLTFLAKRAVVGVETVADGCYRRTVRIERDGVVHAGWLEAHFDGKARASGDTLTLVISDTLAPVVPQVLAAARRLFDVACEPAAVALALGDLARAHPGLRVPGAFDSFEVAVRALLGQQVTVKAATTLAGRFARAFGQPVVTPWPELITTFPTPQRVAGLSIDEVASLGIIASRSRALIELAGRLAAGELQLMPGSDAEASIALLRTVPGIGDWTAHYIAMRALAWPDAFPAADLGVMKALSVTTAKQATAAVEGYRPWRAYAVMHLWRTLEN